METIATATDAKETFSTMTAASRTFGEKADCGVKALAVACGTTYAVAHDALKKQGRRNRRGSSVWQIEKAAKALGCVVETITTPAKAKTMKTVGPALVAAGHTGAYLVYVRKHVAAVVAGHVADWTEGRQHRVKSIVRITPPAKRRRTNTHEMDAWGTRRGTKAARINAAFTTTPQTMKQLMARAGVACPFWNHTLKMIAAGHVIKLAAGYRLAGSPCK
jgi:hypothetical protein